MNKLEAKNTFYNDPRYDVVVDSRMLEQHLKEKDQQIAELKQQLKDTEESYNNTMRYLNKTRSELLNLPKKIVEKIRSKCCVEDKCKDGSFVLGINEKDLDTILKEYQK